MFGLKGYIEGKELQRSAFTPGTKLMRRLGQSLFVYAAERSHTTRNKGIERKERRRTK